MASGYRCQLVPETASFQEPQNLLTELSKCLILLCTEDTVRVYHLSALLKVSSTNLVQISSIKFAKNIMFFYIFKHQLRMRYSRMPPLNLKSVQGICSSSIKTSLNGSCSWASTFQTPTNKTGIVLMYQSHLIEVRLAVNYPEFYNVIFCRENTPVP
mgnify:FL=1